MITSRATRRRLVSALFVAGALCASATTASGQAPGTRDVPPGLGVKLLEGPADDVDDPRAHSYIVDHLEPGTTISRRVAFSNGDPEPAELDFYPAAADIVDGEFVVRPGREANDVSRWTTISPADATVDPGQTVTLTVTIAVPADAESGEHYAAALGELPARPTDSGVSAASRVGIRIYLSVGPGGEPATDFTIDDMTARRDAEGRPVVAATVRNTGGRAVDLAGDLMLTNGPSSLAAGPFAVEVATTLGPGQQGDVTVTLDDELPNGPWDAELELTSGQTTEAATARITFPDAPGTSAPPAPATAAAGDGLPLFLLVAVAVAIAAVLAGAWLLRRRHRHHHEAPAHPQPQDAPTASIH